MAHKSLSILLGMLVLLSSACQTMPARKSENKGLHYERVDPSNLKPVAQLAIEVFEMEKSGSLEFPPFITVDTQGKKLENKTDYSKFRQRNLAITDCNDSPDGTYSQTMISESVDDFGRIDISRNFIEFILREPDDAELAAIEKSMVFGFQAIHLLVGKDNEEFRKAIAEYQQINRLTSDGIPDTKTIQSLSQKISILDVKRLSSRILYPEKPLNTIYVVPFKTVEKDPQMFNKGFSSLSAIKNHALTQNALKALNAAGEQFVVFICFFDRVNPSVSIRVSLAEEERKLSSVATPDRYSGQDGWPVLIQTFSIDKRIGTSPVYVNVFMKRKKSYSCIGSQRIL